MSTARIPERRGSGIGDSAVRSGEPPCVVSWTGKWQCYCGKRYGVNESCQQCGVASPCRDYLRNACTRPLQQCPFLHPPFRLGPPPASVGTRACLVAPEAVGLSPRQVERARSGAQQAQEPAQHCIVSWTGNWQCSCGRRYSVADDCRGCGIPPPCRDYLRNACTRPPQQCPFSHPPFRLGPPPRSLGTHACLVVPQAVGLSIQQAEQGFAGVGQWVEQRSRGGNAPKVLGMPAAALHSRAAGAARQQQSWGAAQLPAALLVQQQQQRPLLVAVPGQAAGAAAAEEAVAAATGAFAAPPESTGAGSGVPLPHAAGLQPPLPIPLVYGGTQLPRRSGTTIANGVHFAAAPAANRDPGEKSNQAELIQLLAMLGVKS